VTIDPTLLAIHAVPLAHKLVDPTDTATPPSIARPSTAVRTRAMRSSEGKASWREAVSINSRA
jgi:hypothetical protein